MEQRKKLTVESLVAESKRFSDTESARQNDELFGVTDGKAIGTYIEKKFKEHLSLEYSFDSGNSARGIDLPGTLVNTDIKVTSIRQPQSSSPFKDVKQKIYGLGYNLLVFVYSKTDEMSSKTSTLDIVSCVFLSAERTADYTMTKRLREMVSDGAIEEDIVGYLQDKNVPADDITLRGLASKILEYPPPQGYLTISNALQCRLQYQRVVDLRDSIDGIWKPVDKVVRGI